MKLLSDYFSQIQNQWDSLSDLSQFSAYVAAGGLLSLYAWLAKYKKKQLDVYHVCAAYDLATSYKQRPHWKYKEGELSIVVDHAVSDAKMHEIKSSLEKSFNTDFLAPERDRANKCKFIYKPANFNLTRTKLESVQNCVAIGKDTNKQVVEVPLYQNPGVIFACPSRHGKTLLAIDIINKVIRKMNAVEVWIFDGKGLETFKKEGLLSVENNKSQTIRAVDYNLEPQRATQLLEEIETKLNADIRSGGEPTSKIIIFDECVNLNADVKKLDKLGQIEFAAFVRKAHHVIDQLVRKGGGFNYTTWFLSQSLRASEWSFLGNSIDSIPYKIIANQPPAVAKSIGIEELPHVDRDQFYLWDGLKLVNFINDKRVEIKK